MLDLGRVDNESANSEVSFSFRNSNKSYFKMTCKQLQTENFSKNVFPIKSFKMLELFL